MSNQINKVLNQTEIKNKKILDIGCGDGSSMADLVDKCQNFYGIDQDVDVVEQAQKNLPNGKFLVGDGQKIPFGDNQFDLVIFSKSLHHHLDCLLALKEAIRVSKPKGLIVIVELVLDTEYQEAIRSFHNERKSITNALSAIEVSGLKVLSQKIVDSSKIFESFEGFLDIQSERFEINKESLEKIQAVLGEKINNKPLILKAQLQLFKLEVNK